MNIPQLIGQHPGFSDGEYRDIPMVMAIYPGIDWGYFNEIKQLNSKYLVKYITTGLLQQNE